MNRIARHAIALAALFAGAAACSETPPTRLVEKQLPPSTHDDKNPTDDPTKDPAEKAGAYAGGQDNTFDHQQDLGAYGGRDPFEILKERQDEGPPEVRTRMHSCQKLPVATLETILKSLGVDLDKSA